MNREVSFHIWSAYSFSPNATWGQLASEWEDARGNPDLLKTFVNTVLGECWEDEYIDDTNGTATYCAAAIRARGEG